MTDLLLLALGASLVNAHLLTSAPRACPLVGITGRFDAAVALSMTSALLAIIAVPLALAGSALTPPSPGATALLLVALVVALTFALDAWLRSRRPVIHGRLGTFLPVAALNGALPGLALLPAISARAPLDALGVAIPVLALFGVAPVCVAGMQVRLAAADAPAAFRGLPLAFLTVGLVALALTGLGGWVVR
jgi:electron transport complex protein RnfA